jgi:hypothetical protein
MKKYRLSRIVFVMLFVVFSLGSKAQNVQASKVDINNFHVEKNKDKVNINWSTRNSQTNYFEVEKSKDGKNFKTVAYVLGADPTKTDCDCYGCFDKINSKFKELYYRLKHVDTNGSVEFSEVKILAMNDK